MPTKFKSDFLNVLEQRGFIHQISDAEGLDALAAKGPITGYIGYDATATSIHIGNLITVTMLYWLQQTGHKAISLMGGGTSMVGDPSGRTDQRGLLTVEQIAANIEGIKTVYGRILNYGGSNPAIMVNNADWLLKLNYVEFLRDVGRYFSVNRMLSFDSVKLRLDRDQSLSFLEFNYMIMQGYDFTELNRRYGTILQMGGSDQWGNIVNGIELGRRLGTPQLYALTCPLLTTASGAKMGKTAAGAVWLNADMLSPYDYWQFWRNTEDGDVGRFLRLFTLLDMDEIARLEALEGADANEAKKVLATEATALLHGREAAELAAETARMTFEQGALAESLPTVEIAASSLDAGLGVLTAFGPEYAKLLPSTGEARRQVKSGGLRVNDQIVTDERGVLRTANLTPEGVIKLSFGKKRHVLLRAV